MLALFVEQGEQGEQGVDGGAQVAGATARCVQDESEGAELVLSELGMLSAWAVCPPIGR